MSNFITLEKALQMINLYRNEKDKFQNGGYPGRQILPFSEKFDGAQCQQVLGQPGCQGLRIYYGMDDDLKIHLIIVAVDANNNDVINRNMNSSIASASAGGGGGEEDLILEEGQLCPPACPPTP